MIDCKEIECKIVRVAHDRGRKTGGLLKLYRDGVEIPTARNIWINFIIINDETTPYHVDSMNLINGKAYDVVIVDGGGLCHYNGLRKRLQQTAYAIQHGEPLPADTQEIYDYNEEQRRKAEAEQKIEMPDLSHRLFGRARHWCLSQLSDPSKQELYRKKYSLRRGDKFTEEQLYDIFYELMESKN